MRWYGRIAEKSKYFTLAMMEVQDPGSQMASDLGIQSLIQSVAEGVAPAVASALGMIQGQCLLCVAQTQDSLRASHP